MSPGMAAEEKLVVRPVLVVGAVPRAEGEAVVVVQPAAMEELVAQQVAPAVRPVVEEEEKAVVGVGLLFYSRTVLHHAPRIPNPGRRDMF